MRSLLLLLTAAAAVAPGAARAQVFNDLEFAIHYVPGTNSYAISTAGASRDAGPGAAYEDPACFPATSGDGDNSVWFAFAAVRGLNGTVTIDLGGSDFDTMLAVYGSDGSVRCDDDGGTGTTSFLEFAPPDLVITRYLVRVTGFQGAEGLLRLAIVAPPVPGTLGATLLPVNDRYSEDPWVTLTTSLRPHYGSTTGTTAQAEPWETSASCASDRNNSVFWSYLAPADGTLRLSTEGSVRVGGQELDTILSVFPQSGPNALTEVACDDDGGPGVTSLISALPVRAGVRYAVRVSTYTGTAGGDGSVTLTPTFTPATAGEAGPNDDALALAAPAPNPTAGTARLAFTLATAQAVRLAVVDVLGREVAVLHDGPAAAGRTEATLDASALPAGVYVARLSAAAGVRTQRVTVAR